MRWTASGHWHLPPEYQVPQKTLTEITEDERLLDYILPLIARSPGLPAEAPLPVYTLEDAANDLFVDRQALLAIFKRPVEEEELDP